MQTKRSFKYRLCKWLYKHGHTRLCERISPSILARLRGEELAASIIAAIDKAKYTMRQFSITVDSAAAAFRSLEQKNGKAPASVLSEMFPEAEHDKD